MVKRSLEATTLLNCDMFEEWQLSLRSEANRTNYRKHLLYFCKIHNAHASELMGKESLEIKDMVKKYLLHLKRNAMTTSGKRKSGEVHVNSLPIYLAGVKSYIDYLEKDISWKKIDSMLPEQMMSEVRAYTREEIKKLMFVADERKRALMFVMLCGVHREGAAQLKVSDFSVFDETYNIGMLWMYGTSKKWRHFTLLTPEATTAIQDYLKWRDSHGEHPIKPASSLIRNKFDEFTANRITQEFMTPSSVSGTMSRLCQRAG